VSPKVDLACDTAVIVISLGLALWIVAFLVQLGGV
jgi:hypothetical protein